MAMSEQQMVEQVQRNILSAFSRLGILSQKTLESLIFKLDRLHDLQKHESETPSPHTPSTLQME